MKKRIKKKAEVFMLKRKKKPEGAEATEAKQETLSMCKGSILYSFLKD